MWGTCNLNLQVIFFPRLTTTLAHSRLPDVALSLTLYRADNKRSRTFDQPPYFHFAQGRSEHLWAGAGLVELSQFPGPALQTTFRIRAPIPHEVEHCNATTLLTWRPYRCTSGTFNGCCNYCRRKLDVCSHTKFVAKVKDKFLHVIIAKQNPDLVASYTL